MTDGIAEQTKVSTRFTDLSRRKSWIRSTVLGATILLSAFLLFQVQPLIGKAILPWFGGSSAVWTACLLFFQAALLLGYLYAHLLTRFLTPRKQALLHGMLLLLSLATLPIVPNERWKPNPSGDPVIQIFRLLLATVGIPYMLLSATSPLLQSWVARQPATKDPYRLFSLSNFGSLLGLLTFPILIEPFFDGRSQARIWSASYAVFVVLCIAAALLFSLGEAAVTMLKSKESAVYSRVEIFRWMALAACGSALLLAVSHHVTQNIAAIPLLWVIPLALYLVTFIMAFAGSRWYAREVFLPLFALGIGAMAYFLFSYADEDGMQMSYERNYLVLISLFSAALFVCCYTLHGELARRKPVASNLTGYYLAISCGGALGALAVAWGAPYFLPAAWEFPILLVVSAVLVLFTSGKPRTAGQRFSQVFAAAGIFILCGFLFYESYSVASTLRRMSRNFYGSLRTFDRSRGGLFERVVRRMDNGNVIHGEQILNAGAELTPTTYYGRLSGVGLAIAAQQQEKSVRMGFVGLGAGTLSVYGRPGDQTTFYEINENDVRLATEEFTFLRKSKANVQIIIGDARLSLEREASRNFDILAVDAFNGDSVPFHLLTLEAFALYAKHLKPGGTLALHLSNRHLRLQPVAYTGLRNLGWGTIAVTSSGIASEDVFISEWLLANRVPQYFESSIFAHRGTPIEDYGSALPWTDNFSSIWQILH